MNFPASVASSLQDSRTWGHMRGGGRLAVLYESPRLRTMRPTPFYRSQNDAQMVAILSGTHIFFGHSTHAVRIRLFAYCQRLARYEIVRPAGQRVLVNSVSSKLPTDEGAPVGCSHSSNKRGILHATCSTATTLPTPLRVPTDTHL